MNVLIVTFVVVLFGLCSGESYEEKKSQDGFSSLLEDLSRKHNESNYGDQVVTINKDMCDFCALLIMRIEQYAAKTLTLETYKETFESICKTHLPTYWPYCTYFFNNYGETIFNWMGEGMKHLDICESLLFCEKMITCSKCPTKSKKIDYASLPNVDIIYLEADESDGDGQHTWNRNQDEHCTDEYLESGDNEIVLELDIRLIANLICHSFLYSDYKAGKCYKFMMKNPRVVSDLIDEYFLNRNDMCCNWSNEYEDDNDDCLKCKHYINTLQDTLLIKVTLEQFQIAAIDVCLQIWYDPKICYSENMMFMYDFIYETVKMKSMIDWMCSLLNLCNPNTFFRVVQHFREIQQDLTLRRIFLLDKNSKDLQMCMA